MTAGAAFDVELTDGWGNAPQQGRDAVLLAAHLALQKIGEADEPIALFNLSRPSERFAEWENLLPRVVPHYAVKCNPDAKFLRELRVAGCSFDCATLEEINQALAIGASPDNIVFSHPCKLRSHLQYAKARGVRLMSFDNAIELRKVAAEFPGASLLLRLICEDASAQCPMSSKFGAARGDWDELLADAAELQLRVVGVSFHVGSGCKDPRSFEKALYDSNEVFGLARARGFEMNVLDVGGGFPGVDTAEVAFEPLASNVAKQLDKHFPAELFPDLRIIAEPGRFFACSAVSLLTKVFAKAQPHMGNAGGEGDANFRYYLNDGVYGSFNCIVYDHAKVEPELLKPTGATPKPCSVFGPTCDGFDLVLQNYLMPELQEGDWLLWRNMGAYTSAAGSKFNGFPLPRVFYFNAETLALPAEPSKDTVSYGIAFRRSSLRSLCIKQIFSSPEELRGDREVHISCLQSEPTVEATRIWSWNTMAKFTLLLFCNGIWALKTIGFSWAASRRNFCPFTPTIVQSIVLAFATLIALVCRHGWHEVQSIGRRRYLWFGISGCLEGLMFCLHNLALTKASAVTVTALMQGEFFIVMLLQAGLHRSYPIMCVASAMCLLFSYKHSTSPIEDEVGGVTLAIGAAFCSGACDFALEYFAKRSMRKATRQDADLMRCLICHEMFKVPIACVMVLVFDTEFVEAGMFHGWDYSVALGGAGASALALVFVNASVVLVGARPTNLALSLEVAIVYLLEVFALHADDFCISRFLEICFLAAMVAMCNFDDVGVLSGERKVYSKASEPLCPPSSDIDS